MSAQNHPFQDGRRPLDAPARTVRIGLGLTDAVVGIGVLSMAPSIATIVLGSALLAAAAVLVATGILGHAPALPRRRPPRR